MRRWTGVPLSVALALAFLGVVFGVRPAAVDAQSVSTWVTLASKNPAVGCVVEISVEARSASGNTVTGVEILLGLVINGEIYSLDRAVTGDDGIVFLALDTSEAFAGGHAQVDVNISGAYMGSAPISLTKNGPCSDNSTMWTTTKEISITQAVTSGDAAAVESAGGTFV